MSFLDFVFGPSLYRIYEVPIRNHEPYNVERYADRVMSLIDIGKTLTVYISPLVVINSIFPSGRLQIFSSFTSYYFGGILTMTAIYSLMLAIRGLSRSTNPTYRVFIRAYKVANQRLEPRASSNFNNEILEARNTLRNKYSFDYRKWPVDFRWSDGKYAFERPARLLPISEASQESLADGPLFQMVSWLMAHSIGRILLYPGSLALFHKILEYNLITGRNFLIENYHAQRYKLLARDNNQIDSIFVNRKKPEDPKNKGNYVVICSDGNAAFYEFGMLTSLLNSQYSLLGWNHPGFADSTGSPYPQNDINAMEVVVNFAVTELGFPLENVILFAWSIGGFPTAWAASNYPEVKGTVIDASFDDVLPLARSRMFPFLAPIVDTTIRNYFNLNLSAYLKHYNGPILFIRRLSDEILTLDPSNPLKTNQGNKLLVKLLANRFPNLISHPEVLQQVKEYLYTPHAGILRREFTSVPTENVIQTLKTYCMEHDVKQFPIEISLDDVDLETAKHIIRYMCIELMINFDSTHCTPLPTSLFREPLDLFSKLS